MPKKAKSSSFSRASDFEKCPLFFRYRHIDKIEDPRPKIPSAEHPLDRGLRLHTLAENYVQTQRMKCPPELEQFKDRLDKLRKLYLKGWVALEERLAFDKTWNLVASDDFENAIYRMVADVRIQPSDEKIIVIDYKGLDLNTKIPTPSGFTTMREIQPGDTVFDKNGAECSVVGKSQVKHLRCYQVTFNDKSEVVCDEEHLWLTNKGEVIGVHDLMGSHDGRQRTKVPQIPTAEPVQYKEQELPIHPYVLGLWIADGKHSSAEITKPDDFIWQKIQDLRYTVNMDVKQSKSCPTRTVQGIRGYLNALGLLGSKKRSIPDIYMQSSIEQRLHLLQGLMDGDGYANNCRRQAVFCTVQEDLSQQVMTLLCSLGQQPYQTPFNAKGFGKEVRAYYVVFRPRGINPFTLPRKAEKVPTWGEGRSAYRRAIKVEEILSRPTQCIAVDSPSNTFLCTERMIPTHNSGKKDGNEVKHHDQCMEYATSYALLSQKLQEFTIQLWYFDQPRSVGNPTIKVFTREQVLANFPKMRERHEKVIGAELFPAHPSMFACRFCPYKAGLVGRDKKAYAGTGHCRRNVC